MEGVYKVVVIVLAVLFLGAALYLISSPTGFLISEELGDGILNATWGFSDSSGYVYNSSEISFGSEGASLAEIVSFTNWTDEEVTEINLVSAMHDSKNKTSKVEAIDGKKFKPSAKKILNVEFESDLNNGDVLSVYALSSDSEEIYLCETDVSCNISNYGSVSYDGNEGFYNFTISGLDSPTNLFSLVAPKVKLDYIHARSVSSMENSFTNSSYPTSSIIETSDVTGIESIVSFGTYSSLNNQSVNYLYSSDSGETWSEIPADVSSLDVSKIRFSAELVSDGLGTPVLEMISLVYSGVVVEAVEERRTFTHKIDLNSAEKTVVDNSDIVLDFVISENVSDANITIEEIEDIPMDSRKILKNLLDIEVDNQTKDYLNSTTLKIYYTDEDVSSENLDEATLRFYYYNESSLEWEAMDSTVNVNENYVEVVLPHLSIYGIFGEEVGSSQGGSGSSSGGGSGRSSSSGSGSGSDSTPQIPSGSVNEEENEEATDEKVEPLEASVQIPSDGKGGLTGFPVFDRVVSSLNERNVQIIVGGILIIGGYVLYRSLSKHKKKIQKVEIKGFKKPQ